MRVCTLHTNMKLLLIIPLVALFFIIPHAQAEIFSMDGRNADMSIFIAIEDNSSIIKLQTNNGYSEHWDSKVKFYKSGGFSIKNPESGVLVYGHQVSDSQYDLVILTSQGVQRLTATTNQFNEIEDVSDDTPQRIEPKSSIGSDIKQNLPEPKRYEPSKEIDILVRFDEVSMIFVNDEYAPNVKVINENYLTQYIEDVNMTLEVTRDDNPVKTVSGTTNKFGAWNPVIKMTYPTFYPGFCYDVTITGQWQNQTQIETDDFLVTTIQKYWEYGEEYSLGRDKIESDYDCNE